MTNPSKNYGFVRCDSEFETIGQDLDMSTMGIVKGIPMYQMPDISRELMLLEEQLKFSAKGKEDKRMLAIGTKVIVRTCDDYNGRHCGRVGTVCRYFAKDKKVGVMFEGIKNTASKDGIFWFQNASLTPYKEPSTILSINDVKSVIFNGGKTISVYCASRPEMCGLFTYGDRFVICDGYRLLRLTNDISSIPHVENDFDVASVMKGLGPTSETLQLPTVGELRAHIITHNVKRGRKTITTSYFLDNFIHVNPQYLIDMIQALPGCTAYKPQSQTSPIYFEAPNGDDGILLPVRPPHNPSDDVSNEKTTS